MRIQRVQDKEIPIFKCVDKNDEHWTKDRDLLAYPRPFRTLMLGIPGSGKTSLIKSLISSYKPPLKPFARIYVWTKSNKEWENYCDKLLTDDDILEDNFYKDEENVIDKHKLLVIDDKILKDAKIQIAIIHLFTHVSSHYKLSICVSVQSKKMIPAPEILACINIYNISTNLPDVKSVCRFCDQCGVNYYKFKGIYSRLVKQLEFNEKKHGWVTIDCTHPQEGYNLRFNHYNLLIDDEPEEPQ